MASSVSYVSTSGSGGSFSFARALQLGLSPDGGLFFPDHIPQLPKSDSEKLKGASSAETGKVLLWPWLKDNLSREDFDAIISDALNFDAPLKQLGEDTFILELFHGPTLAFKDFAARTMGRLMAAMLRRKGEMLHVLTATSGDTGAAVADGFYGVEGITVWVLYPSGKVSPLQEKQFTTLGGNIRALEVDGTFDDCQRLVKQAFVDDELRAERNLTSANSINIGRLLPQMVYYSLAVSQLREKGFDVDGAQAPVFVVPSGNFGNITAGLFASRMGIPAGHFVAACNQNQTFYDYIQSKKYKPRPSVRTMSNAMDVGDPSNFARIEYLYERDPELVSRSISAFRTDDTVTAETIRSVYKKHGYIMDPHTAVGFDAWKQFKSTRKTSLTGPGVVLATAHPAKFGDVMPEEIAGAIEQPEALRRLSGREKKADFIAPEYPVFRAALLK